MFIRQHFIVIVVVVVVYYSGEETRPAYIVHSGTEHVPNDDHKILAETLSSVCRFHIRFYTSSNIVASTQKKKNTQEK